MGYSYYSYNITYSVQLSCSIPWSGDIEVNPVTLFVTQKFPFTNLAKMSECCLSVSCIVLMYRGSKQAWLWWSCVKKYFVRDSKLSTCSWILRCLVLCTNIGESLYDYKHYTKVQQRNTTQNCKNKCGIVRSLYIIVCHHFLHKIAASWFPFLIFDP